MSNCQVEEEFLENKVQHNGIDKDKISLLQFKNETNLNPKQILSYTTPKKNNTSKQTMRFSDFIIDTLAIKKHISLTNKTTYTFRIYPLSAVAQPNEIYNLVYHKVNNSWETSIFYLKKFPKSDNKQKLFEKIERIYQGTVANSLTSKTTSLEMCTFETTSYHCTNSGECSRTGICDLCYLCTSTTITYESCASGGGSGGGGLSDPGNTSGGGGTADPYAYAPNFYDNPVYDDPNYINAVKRSYVWTNLGDAGQGFFASNQDNMNAFNQIIQYQIDENWSDESCVFAQEMLNYLSENNFNGIIVPAINQFVKEMINSMVNNYGYSSDGFMGDTDYDNIDYSGPKQLIPQSIILNDGSTLIITFGTTQSDNKNSNNEVAVDLVNSIKFAINLANSNLENSNKITSIYIAATTNGTHSSTSNHTRGTAVDISRINGTKMINLGNNIQVKALQDAFDNYPSIRENFGPSFKHKTFPNGSVNLNWPIGGHQDHIHVSVQSY